MDATARTQSLATAFPVEVDGVKGCGFCRKPLPGRKRHWCSRTCLNEAWARSSRNGLRWYVFWRDLGVCAKCGWDTEKFLRVMQAAAIILSRNQIYDGRISTYGLVRDLGFDLDITTSLWQADHIIPLSEGGENSPTNARTLCIPCHKTETAELRRRLAAARRGPTLES